MNIIIQAFSDYICPSCYLSEIALRQAALKTRAQVVHRAYQLHPSDAPPDASDVSGLLNPDAFNTGTSERWRNSIYPLAASLGLEIHQPARLSQTRRAHEAAAWARHQSAFEPFHQALFRSVFIDGKDIGNLVVLKEIAFNVGLNPAELERALTERAMAEEVDEDLMIGRTYGVTSVPTLVIGGHLLVGLQTEEALIRAIDAVRSGVADEEKRKLPHLPINITRK